MAFVDESLWNQSKYNQYWGTAQHYLNTGLDRLKDAQSPLGTNFDNLFLEYQDATKKASNAYNGVIGNLKGISNDIGIAIQGYGEIRDRIQPTFVSLDGIRDELSSIANDIDRFIPEYAGKLNGVGDSIISTGASLVDQGGLFNTEARNLMNMQSGGGGLIDAFIQSINAIDPEKYVSMAVTDVQRQYQNAQSQQNRQLGRSGVDAGSARSVALNQQYAQAMAAASAGAKFRARLTGQQERMNAINQAIGTANALAETGASITGAGLSAQAAGIGVIGNAAGLELSGVNSKLNVANSKMGIENAWLNALGMEMNTYNAQIQGGMAQAQIQNQISANETQKVNNAANVVNMAISAGNAEYQRNKAIAEAELSIGRSYQNQANIHLNYWNSAAKAGM